MTQFINPKPVAAMANMGARPDPYTQGMGGVLSLAEGGLARKPYLFGGIKRAIKKLIPKEAAGIMQMAAPFVAPSNMWAAAALSGLGQYKQSGRINPLQLAMSVAPGIRNKHMAAISGDKWGQVGKPGDSWLRTQMGKWGPTKALENKMFGTASDWVDIGSPSLGDLPGKTSQVLVKGTEGWLGDQGVYGGLGDLVTKGGEALLMKGPKSDRELDKMALAALALGGMSYAEAKKQFKLAGQGDLEDDYGITEDIYEQADWEGWAKGTHLESAAGNAEGGLPRIRHAMGSAQFPPQKRTGLQWGSDKGEGLGGEEVEADMRYTGGFMPYGDKPKADDVPARLSKDEFVFTDEAVAGMGGGDVNLGAERLYNMMKNLEQQGAPGQMGIGAMV